MNLAEIQELFEKAEPGVMFRYYTGKTGWSSELGHAGVVHYFKRLHASGEWDFVQKKVGTLDGKIGLFEHYAIRRKTKRNVINSRYEGNY